MVKSVLITGCAAGGIGYALATTFQSRGLTVFATARNLSKISGLKDMPNVHLLSLDVCDPISIAAAVKAVKEITGGKLDYLVNNSGKGYNMPALDSDIEEGKRLFEVNFWGVLRMVQAFSSLLIDAKGTVVTIGSGVGLVHMPYMSIYNSSKAAVHMLDENLRIEMAPLGVKVLTVVAGSVATTFGDNNKSGSLPKGSRYEPVKKEFDMLATWDNGTERMSTEVFAKRVVDDILGGVTGRTYRGTQASVARYSSTGLPMFVIDRILTKGSGLDTWKA